VSSSAERKSTRPPLRDARIVSPPVRAFHRTADTHL